MRNDCQARRLAVVAGAILGLGLAACEPEFVATSATGTGGSSNTSVVGGAGTSGRAGGSPTGGVATTSDATTTTSSVPSGCGDGVQAAEEQCDDGDEDDGNACSSACEPATCGDGVVWIESGVDFEQCDDGNAVDGDGCSSDCAQEQCDPSPCDDPWPGGECAQGCDPQLCEGNGLCVQAGIACDGSRASECAGRCMLYAADCAVIKGWPNAPESAHLRSCLQACALLPS